MAEVFDAVILGAGPAGSTASIILARAGWRVAIVERRPFPRRKVCGEYLSATNWPLLDLLGIAPRFLERAGPEVLRMALLAGSERIEAPLPRPAGGAWGRALSREELDTLLLEEAVRTGVEVRQPATARWIDGPPGRRQIGIAPGENGREVELRAPVVIAAHGSWEPGGLPTSPARRAPRDGDLLAFKAHLRGSGLPADLMPLLTFPGGYGGMVHCDGGKVSISTCVRRDLLDRIRGGSAGAGEAVGEHIRETCPAARPFLDGAERDGAWLSAGPIRPGFRPLHHAGIFAVGNAAGEAHPIIAEGISMALQSAWILARILARASGRAASDGERAEAAREYASSWRSSFAPRIRAAAAFARWSLHPGAIRAALPLLRCFPALLTLGARWSGKDRRVVSWQGPRT